MAIQNPPKERMCHRTGFAQSCRELVVSEKCGRWGHLELEQTDGSKDFVSMCVDDMEIGLTSHLQKLVNQVIGSLDALRVEAKEQHQAALQTNAAVMQAALTASKNIERQVAEALEALHCELPSLMPPEKTTPLLAAPASRKGVS